jgi:hypothetical protein
MTIAVPPRVCAVTEAHVFVFQFCVGFAVGVDREVADVTVVVAFGAVEAMLLARRVEVSACGFKIRSFAFGILMEVDRVLTGREVAKMELQADAAGFFFPQGDGADIFALGVFEVDFRFGGERKRGHDDCESGKGKSQSFHEGIIDRSETTSYLCAGCSTKEPFDSQDAGVYCDKVFNLTRDECNHGIGSSGRAGSGG